MNPKNRHRKVASVMLLVVGIPLLFAGFLSGAGSASAAVIPSAITSISTTATSVGQWDVVNFTCDWAVPDNSKAGDTFEMQLPPELAWWGAANFNLTDSNGDVVATAVADSTGLVTFTLTGYVTSHPLNIGGTCAFSTQYVAAQTAPGAETLTFPVGSTAISVPIVGNGPCVTNCDGVPPTEAAKYMWWVDGMQSQLQSQIIAPLTTGEINTVTITDTPGSGLGLDCSTKYVAVGKAVSPNGTIAEPSDTALYPPSTFNCTPAELTVEWTNLPAGEYVQLFVQATPSNASQGTYSNAGLVTMNGQDFPVAAQQVSTSAGGTGNGTAPASTPATSPVTTPATTPSTAPATTPAATPATTATTTPALVPATAGSTKTSAAAPLVSATTTAAVGNELAYTGASSRPLIIGAGILLIAGAAALGLGRTRVRQH